MDLVLPPINRAMRNLDRSFFRKVIPISAARMHKLQRIASIRAELEASQDALVRTKFPSIRPDPVSEIAQAGGKCLLLKPEIRHDDTNTWSATILRLVQAGDIGVIPYELHLTYDDWTHSDILAATLPEEAEDIGTVKGFTTVGHIAHFNLRDHLLPYKHLIGAVILDKNIHIRTVINKLDSVGEDSEFRTFKYEVLAGSDDLNVTVKESDCLFQFDYGKVYWNPRLETEHRRLISLFQQGDAICDVMAGVGPFSVPAGKKGVFAWANDMNPDSHRSLQEAIRRNKVDNFVTPFCEDGRTFIRRATAALLGTTRSVSIHPTGRSKPDSHGKHHQPRPVRYIAEPVTFSHYIMNLPGSALSFLPSFVGLYPAEAKKIFTPYADRKLPMVHAYCFGAKSDDGVTEEHRILKEISKQLRCQISLGDEGVSVTDVRDVAPNKRMYCASFRLPPEVAFERAEGRQSG